MDPKQKLIEEIKQELIDSTLQERIEEMIDDVRRDLMDQVTGDLEQKLSQMSVDELSDYLKSIRTPDPQPGKSLREKLKGRA